MILRIGIVKEIFAAATGRGEQCRVFPAAIASFRRKGRGDDRPPFQIGQAS